MHDFARAYNPKPDLTSSKDHIRRLNNQATTYISRMLPDIHTDITTTRQEIWTDFSYLHYKHDHHQETASRKAIKENSPTTTQDM